MSYISFIKVYSIKLGEFQNSDFKNLKKTYSIWIIMHSIKEMKGYLMKEYPKI